MFNINYGVFSFQKQKFRSSKNAIVVNDVVMKMIIFNKYPCAKKALSILSATKVMKNLCCVYCFSK